MAAETIPQEEPKKGSAKTKRAATRKKTTSRKKKGDAAAVAASPSLHKGDALIREVGGLLSIVIALGVFLAIMSFDPSDLAASSKPSNLIGPAGVLVGDWLLTIFGLGALGFDALLWYLGFVMLVGKRIAWRPGETVGQMLFLVSSTMFAHLSLAAHSFFGRAAGGIIGEWGAEIARGIFGTVGAYLVATSFGVVSILLLTNMSLGAVVRRALAMIHKGWAILGHKWRVYLAYRARLEDERQRLIHAAAVGEIDPALLAAELSIAPIVAEKDYGLKERFEDDVDSKLTSKLGRLFGSSRTKKVREKRSEKEATSTNSVVETSSGAPSVKKKAAPQKEKSRAESLESEESGEAWSMGDAPPSDVIGDVGPTIHIGQTSNADFDSVDDAKRDTLDVDDIDIVAEGSEPSPLGEDDGDFGPRIVESEAKERARRIKELLASDDGEGILFKPQRRGSFELPKISYLNYEDGDEDSVDIEQLRQMAAQIEKTLSDFKVEGQIRDICPGPVITVFEFSPAPGVKISKIANLSDDLAMALSALSVRIVAPIPGKGVVGIEVPNPSREIVYMKEIIADKIFYENKKMALPMGLGKDTAGNPVVTDLAKMPHLLVAGATGSGKSVAVNTMITSLLYKNSPDDVRLIMVDPKMLEFSIYAHIPHLLLPVVTDPKQATVALNWVVQEMERRYQLLADLNVRNIKGYNDKVATYTAQAQEDMLAQREDSRAMEILGVRADGTPEHKHMPYIVVIIDEFADLMMTASKDVETAVARLAQKARAAGIHLILATQRPSTDVITGLIKANFPTRIALRVTSKTDSRVILDSNGAENLLGNGDMLFVPPGTSYIQRVHGAYVSEHEIDKVVEHLKDQGDPQYNEEILREEDEESESPLDQEYEKDEHYEDAVTLVIESGQASISMIQRKLRVGYNRAARMVEVMEREGLVSAPDGCKPREVLVDVSPYA